MPPVLSEKMSHLTEEFLLIDENGLLNPSIEEEIKKPEKATLFVER